MFFLGRGLWGRRRHFYLFSPHFFCSHTQSWTRVSADRSGLRCRRGRQLCLSWFCLWAGLQACLSREATLGVTTHCSMKYVYFIFQLRMVSAVPIVPTTLNDESRLYCISFQQTCAEASRWDVLQLMECSCNSLSSFIVHWLNTHWFLLSKKHNFLFRLIFIKYVKTHLKSDTVQLKVFLFFF